MKARGVLVTEALLRQRVGSGKLGVSKWIQYCRFMLAAGYTVHLYEARQTVSKYVTTSHGGAQYVVRFSNHKPNKRREMNHDCDMFVGVTHTGSRTMDDAIRVCLRRLEGDKAGNYSREQVDKVAKEEQDKAQEEELRGAFGSMDFPAPWWPVYSRDEAQE